jgi:hypothetical protein
MKRYAKIAFWLWLIFLSVALIALTNNEMEKWFIRIPVYIFGGIIMYDIFFSKKEDKP